MAYEVFQSLVVQIYCALILLLTSGITSSCCAAENTYNVYPKEACRLPRVDRHFDCLTLSEVLSERDKYFTSNSRLVFHDGDHKLQGEVVSVSNISNFTLQGYSVSVSGHSTPTITCMNSSFWFSYLFMHISSIHFNYCSISLWQSTAVVQDSRFESGRAYEGGALAVQSSSVHFVGSNSFAGNVAKFGGGAIYADWSNLAFSGNTIFTGNKASHGGAVNCNQFNILSFDGVSTFMSNTAEQGGAVFAGIRNTLSFNCGNCNFVNNSAEWGGGAVIADTNNAVSFSGDSTFMSNTAKYGGAVDVAAADNILTFNGNSCFINNAANYGGAVELLTGSTLGIGGSSSFMNNTAKDDGGAVYITGAKYAQFVGNTSFISNTAGVYGGAVLVEGVVSFSGKSDLINNTAGYGGAMFCKRASSVSFSGESVFEDNVAIQGGGIALFGPSTSVYLSGMVSLSFNIARNGGGAFLHDSAFETWGNINITVEGNKATHGGGLFLQSSMVKLQSGCFLENVAVTKELQGGYGGALLAHSSSMYFEKSFYFGNNLADFGGGLALTDGLLLIKQGTELSFKGNQARRRGGAIYVKDHPFTSCTFDTPLRNLITEPCFFQMTEQVICEYEYSLEVTEAKMALNFDNNTANQSGDIMYGGLLESCVVCGDSVNLVGIALGLKVFQKISEYHGSNGYSRLSSDPYKVCICESNVPNCDQREVNVTLYPGQELAMYVVAVGQMNGTVPSVIHAVSDDLITTSNFKETQPTENNQDCSQLDWPLLSKHSRVSMELYSDEQCSNSRYPLTFQINFLPCPVGFSLSGRGSCICDERLQKYTQNCSIQTLTIKRLEGDSFWVGVEGSEKLILHPHCPFDYCTEESTHISLNTTTKYNSTDMQCANGRSGILCGVCQSGRSLALGSSRCLSGCSNGYLALLLVFVFAGVVLVAFLFLCRLTVAEGTLSGLIFYANVLAVNQTVFFPSGERNLFTVFIAWLNLDLGIETCFFESLDTYYSTWLQFAFPIYIWVIVGTIVVLADRSVLVAKIIGSANPVAVLATLFLLSYTKLLRAMMAAFSFTSLDYPDGESKYVWLYDGNIEYLDRHDGRHIGLFLFSLLFLLFVFLPYTLLLLCGQWIQRKLWWIPSTWQLYIKSFLDAYYGPYKDRHRYWTGLLLLLRFFMLLVATVINIRNPQDPFSNLLVIQVVCLVACCWDTVTRGLYKKWYLNLLEISFFLNLIVLVGGTYQVRQSGGNQAALVYTSVGVVFVTFIGIVISAVVKLVKEKVAQCRRRAIHQIANTIPDDEDLIQLNEEPGPAPPSGVTYSVLEIVRNDLDQTSGEIELRPATPDTNQ